jgi:hypothetical protein
MQREGISIFIPQVSRTLLPYDVSVAGPIPVVDFENNGLVTRGDHHVAVIGRVLDRVGVHPIVRCGKGRAGCKIECCDRRASSPARGGTSLA